jgi:transcriptional regulator of acetoin/glycerol metabolism
MEKAVILIDENVIEANDINDLLDVKSDSISNNNKAKTKDDFEREYILSILKTTDWHLGRAAKTIGIDRSTLFRKMKKLNIKTHKIINTKKM